MSTVITWAIRSLDRTTADGKVFTAHYTVDANDGTYSAGAYGSTGFDGELTVPYNELTPTVCIEWVKRNLGPEQVTQIEEALQKQIDEQKAPTKASGVPW